MPYFCLAWACIVLGAAGIFLPLLPTTPFLLVAAWAAPKASPRLDAWLLEHRYLGPPIHAWRSQRAVPARAKRVACTLLCVSWIVMAATARSYWVPALTAILFLCVGIYVCTRPLPRQESAPHAESRI